MSWRGLYAPVWSLGLGATVAYIYNLRSVIRAVPASKKNLAKFGRIYKRLSMRNRQLSRYPLQNIVHTLS